MSSHTDEAVQAAVEKIIAEEFEEGAAIVKALAVGVVAELNRPAIHPACYVVYYSNWSNQDVVCTADYLHDGQTHVSNVRVLILAETVMKWLDQWRAAGSVGSFGPPPEEFVADRIAYLTSHGPDCIDGGTDELHGAV